MAVQQVKTRVEFDYYANFGGLNTRGSRYRTADGQAREADNIIPSKAGGFKARGGQPFVNAVSPAGSPSYNHARDFMRTVTGTTTSIKMAWGDDGNVYDFTADPPTTTLSGLSINARASSIVTRGFVCFCNGVDEPKKFDGTTWTRWGIAAPVLAETPTLGSGGAGSPNGTYRFRVAFRRNPTGLDPGHVSSMGVPTGAITVTNQIINVTNIPICTDPQVNARDLLVEIQGEWYIATTINDNTTTSYAYNMLDTVVILLEKGRTDRNPPPTGLKLVEIVGDVVYGSDGAKLYWTILDEFESWSELNRASNGFQTDDGTQIIALKAFVGLTVMKDRSLWVRSGDDISYTIEKKFGDHGCVAQESPVVKDNLMYYLAHDGFRVFDGNNSEIISGNIDDLLFSTSTAKILFPDRIGEVTGANYTRNDVKTICWSIPTSASESTKMLLYLPEFRTMDVTDPTGQKQVGSWVMWSSVHARRLFVTFDPLTKLDELYEADWEGFMRQLDSGYDSDGVNVAYREVDHFFGAPVQSKRVRDVWFTATVPEGVGAPTDPAVVEWYINGVSSGIQRNLTFALTGDLFDAPTTLFDSAHFAYEGTLINWVSYTQDPFLTIAARITWTVTDINTDLNFLGWTYRILAAGYRRKKEGV